LDRGIRRGAFDAAVPAPVVVGAVAIALAVRFVVLPVERDEVVQREPVVAGHEVDAALGLALLVRIERRAAEHAADESLDRSLLTAEEAADVVAEAAVPFPPAVADESADLVEPGGIPRFGDELRPRQRGVRLDVPEHRRAWHHVSRLV